MKKYFHLFLLLLSFSFLNAQEQFPCHSDEMHYKLVQEQPNMLSHFELKRQELETFTKNFEAFHAKSGPYIIPVVFHVIHMNGDENVSDDQLFDAIKNLNEQYNKRNADTSLTIAAFKGIAANVEIEFRLAKLDPDGNCTNGITRHYSPTSAIGDHSVKSVVHWPREKYLNVYVCKSATSGMAGHALMPPVADTLPDWDGIVMSHDYVGTIGTSQWTHRTVLSHEVGHYLNLYHIWGGNNVPGFYYLTVASSGNCAYDDEVADTPNTIGWQSCSISGSSCGGLDNVQNFMDYSYCSTMFTEGQKQRMHAALNSPIAQRNNLWQEQNLIETGVLGTGNLCNASIEVRRPYACLGDTVDIFDRSYHNIVSRAWDIPDGTIVFQQDSVVRVVFNQEGKVDVTLTVSDGLDTIVVQEIEFIEILPATVSNQYLWEDFENIGLTSRTVLLNNDNNWNFTNYSASGEYGYFMNNHGNGSYNYDFDLRPINLVGVTNPAIVFDRAYAKLVDSEMETLEIKASNDCGVKWNTFRAFTSNTLKTFATELQTGPYVPSTEDWASINSFVIPAGYRKAHTMIRFSYQGKGYNDLYIDNINVGVQNQLSTTHMADNVIAIYPNPTSNTFTITNSKDVPFTVSIYDVAGKEIAGYSFSFGAENTIDVKQFNVGFYLVKITSDGKEITKRLIIER